MRAMALVVWAIVFVALLWPMLRRWSLSARRRRELPVDELVKDPVCRTYVVRSRAISREEAGESRYFCSNECARRYALER
jgi:YHS domain-containing protein